MEQKEARSTFLIKSQIKTDNMKKVLAILSSAVMLLACSTHLHISNGGSSLVGIWKQPNVTLELKSNGHYTYLYKEDGYSNKQSGKYAYYADKDSVILYGFYPDAYTKESRNEHWTIRKLTSDSLVVYVHKPTVVLGGDTLNTVGDSEETYTRRIN